MNSTQGEELSVAVLLSGREKFGAYRGGAVARWTYEVYRHLIGKVDVTVFGFPTSDDDRYPLPHVASNAWKLSVLAAGIPVVRRYEDWIWLRSLIARLRNHSIVHIHNRPQWASLLRELGYSGAIILHLHNDHLGRWHETTLNKLAGDVDSVVTCSGYLRGTFAAKSAALDAKTAVVFNGVNTELFCPREDLREEKTILFVGRLDPLKGVLALVQAYGEVLRDHPDAKLVIGGTTGFGTHEETAYVRQIREAAAEITSHGRGSIEFPGYIHHDRDLPRWFQRATIFASPSLCEDTFGLVNAEAMACGTVVIGSRRGGIPEVLGDAGPTVDPESLPEFAGAMSALLADPRLRGDLAIKSLERAQRLFAWPVIAQQWHELLTKIRQHKAFAAI